MASLRLCQPIWCQIAKLLHFFYHWRGQRLIVKTTQKSRHTWSAIFSVIVYFSIFQVMQIMDVNFVLVQGVKNPTPGHKVRKFHRCIYKLPDISSFLFQQMKLFFNEDTNHHNKNYIIGSFKHYKFDHIWISHPEQEIKGVLSSRTRSLRPVALYKSLTMIVTSFLCWKCDRI